MWYPKQSEFVLLINFFLSSEYDDSNGDGGDDEDGSSSADTAGNAGGSRSVVGCKWRGELIYSRHLIRNLDEM